MLRKILKYDMNYIRRIWWILAVSVLGLSVISASIIRLFIEFGASDNAESNIIIDLFLIFGMFFAVIAIVVIIASLIGTEVLILVRFYKNFFTDEGYLTFTLPVSRKKLLLSKTLNAMIWLNLHVVLLAICVMIYMLIVPTGDSFINLTAFKAVGEFISSLWSQTGAWLILYALEIVLILEVMLVFSVSLMYYCITMGSVVAKKHKVLAAIGIYYLANSISSVINTVLMFTGGLCADGLFTLLASRSALIGNIAIFISLLILFIIYACLAMIMYFMTLGKLERRLNLA